MKEHFDLAVDVHTQFYHSLLDHKRIPRYSSTGSAFPDPLWTDLAMLLQLTECELWYTLEAAESDEALSQLDWLEHVFELQAVAATRISSKEVIRWLDIAIINKTCKALRTALRSALHLKIITVDAACEAPIPELEATWHGYVDAAAKTKGLDSHLIVNFHYVNHDKNDSLTSLKHQTISYILGNLK